MSTEKTPAPVSPTPAVPVEKDKPSEGAMRLAREIAKLRYTYIVPEALEVEALPIAALIDAAQQPSPAPARDGDAASTPGEVYAYPPTEPWAPDGETWKQRAEALRQQVEQQKRLLEHEHGWYEAAKQKNGSLADKLDAATAEVSQLTRELDEAKRDAESYKRKLSQLADAREKWLSGETSGEEALDVMLDLARESALTPASSDAAASTPSTPQGEPHHG